MVKFIQILIITIVIGGTTMPIAAASTYSVAVLPVTDLTHGLKGLNPEITAQLIKQLRQQGMEVIEPNKIVEFMVQHGIRRCDKIDSFTARKMAIALKCDSLLLTTLYRQELTTNQSNLILTLLHGKNGQPVWSKVSSMHLDDTQPLFGIKRNRNLTALQADQIQTITQQFIEQLPSLPVVNTQDLLPAQVINVQLNNSFTKGESPINCRLKIKFLGATPDSLLLSGGLQPITLQRTTTPDIYTGTIISKGNSGDHNLNLSMRWQHKQKKTMPNFASYKVVNDPAQLTLRFLNGIAIGEVQAFSSEIKIIPKMQPHHPLDLWRITMSDERGDTVFSETRHAPLPTEMLWKGTNNNHRQLDSGYYTLSLKIRDLAGNETETTSKLYLQSTKMELVNIQQYTERGQRKLELLPTATMLIPIDNWILTLETEVGEPKFTQAGTQLPATITVPGNISAQKLFCYFLVKDKLGNQYDTTTTQLITTKKAGILAQIQPPQNNWKADF